MKFTFIGDGENDPDSVTVFGHEFTLGGPAVEVEDAHAIRKLSANANFSSDEVPVAPVKRKPGRPKGSPNRPPAIQQVEVPDED